MELSALPWANPNLLEDIGVKREIDETREAERYKFGYGGPLVSSMRVIAPVVVAGTERWNRFQRSFLETVVLGDWSRFSHSLHELLWIWARKRSGLEQVSTI